MTFSWGTVSSLGDPLLCSGKETCLASLCLVSLIYMSKRGVFQLPARKAESWVCVLGKRRHFLVSGMTRRPNVTDTICLGIGFSSMGPFTGALAVRGAASLGPWSLGSL